ncbi:MAG: DEAD/DEAH box helicase [Bacteroidota bacterium]
MTFKSLGVIDPILRALTELNYEHPTPIQEQAIPLLLEGKDLLGCAQTGTGKTAAFALPLIQHLLETQQKGPRKIRCLILAPTRELAIQINESISAYRKFTRLRNTVIFGGVKQGPQTATLERGVDILVATPGRLLDLIGQGYISLRQVEYFVLDEADHMLDMGFIHDIRKVVAQLPNDRQSLFFSATMPPAILKLSKSILGQPEKITIKPEQATAERVEQQVYFVPKKAKRKLLRHIIGEKDMESVLVFSRTKHGANRIVKELVKKGVTAAAIHGNKTQGARQRALKAFRDGEITALVATDIAARGIDVSALPFVINFDLPNVPETYVHRIGRTGRAEASGLAISFCDVEERPYLKDIQKLIRQQIPVIEEHPFLPGTEDVSATANSDTTHTPKRNQNERSRNNNRRRNNKRSGQQQNQSTQQAKAGEQTQGETAENQNSGSQRQKKRNSNKRRRNNRRRGNAQNAQQASEGNQQNQKSKEQKKSADSNNKKGGNDRNQDGKKRRRRSNDIGQGGMWPLLQ